MSAPVSEPELRELRKLAEELSRRLGERASTAHLLAAIVAEPSSTSELLRERRISPDDVLRTARGLAGDELAEPIVSALTRAKEIGARMGTNVPSSPHLLLALLGEPRAVARRCLELLGVDASRLRAQTMQVGLGLVGRRRPTGAKPAAAPAPAVIVDGDSLPLRRSNAIKVPLVPVSAPMPKKLLGPAEAVPLMQLPTPAHPVVPLESKVTEPKLTITRLVPPSPPAPPSPLEQRFQLDPQKFP